MRSGSFRKILLAAALLSLSGCAQQLRVAMDYDLCLRPIADNWRSIDTSHAPLSMADSVTKVQMLLLHYYDSLGYTHVLYNVLNCDQWPYRFDTVRHVWRYAFPPDSIGNYRAGRGAHCFRVAKKAIESCHLQMIPIGPCGLTHMDLFIKMDPSLSEFWDPVARKDTFASYILQPHHGTRPHNPSDSIPVTGDHIAYVGNYPSFTNPSADSIVGINLHIIKANWGSSGPAFIHLTHDENGYGTDLLVAEGRAHHFLGGATKADLIAREIAFRCRQASEICGNRVQFMFWGDSYLPADNGEMFGLCGDPITGAGGVLHKLKYDATVLKTIGSFSDRMIIMPWMYSFPDGYWRHRGTPERDRSNPYDVQINKAKQLRFLSNLEYRYMTLSGEDGGIDDGALVEREKQCTLEWVRTSQAFPRLCAGYAFSTWTSRYRCDADSHWEIVPNSSYFLDRTDPGTLMTGFTSVLLAYCGWIRPDLVRPWSRTDLFDNCQYRLSRARLCWNPGFSQPFPTSIQMLRK